METDDCSKDIYRPLCEIEHDYQVRFKLTIVLQIIILNLKYYSVNNHNLSEVFVQKDECILQKYHAA